MSIDILRNEAPSQELLNKKLCIFCEIIAGREPAGIITETSKTLVIAAREEGYPLMLTKTHYENLLDPRLDNTTAEELGLMQREMAQVVSTVNNGADISVIINNGRNAGQEIFHLHIHIMPRDRSDRRVIIRIGEPLSLEERYLKASLYRQAIQKLQNP